MQVEEQKVFIDLPNGNKQIVLSDGAKVEMRKPKVKDVRLVKHIKDEEDRELAFICNLTMLSETEIDDKDLKDYRTLQEVLQSFL